MNRRTFLTGSLLSGLAAPLAISTAADSSQPGGMTLGFSTYGTKLLKTEQAIELLSRIGYDSIEMTIWPGWDADSATMPVNRRNELRKRLADSGLKLTSLMEHLHIDEKDRSAAERSERVKLAAQLAHDLAPDSPPLMQTTIGGGGNWADKKGGYADELHQWLKIADAQQLTISVKPHRGGAFSRPDEAVELIEQLDKPKRLRMCYDYSHYDFRDMTLEGTIKTALPWIAHVAVKDVIQKNGRPQFVLAGESGRIDYARLIRLLYEGGYRGDICSEVSGQVWSQPGYTPAKAARTCYTNLSAAFRESEIPRS